MINLTPREVAPTITGNISNSFFKGARIAKDNILWGIPMLAFEAGTAKPGEQLPTLTGRLTGLAASPLISGLASAGLTAVLGLPPAAAAIAGLILAAYAGTKIENQIIKGLTFATTHVNEARRLAFGGDCQDTVSAQKRRQRAMRDLVNVMPQARQWMGQEALILHR